MITINMARACCGVLGNVSLRSTIHTLAWDTGPARCDTAARLRRGALEPLGIVVDDQLSESEIPHTTSAQPTRMIGFHVRTRFGPTDGPSVVKNDRGHRQ